MSNLDSELENLAAQRDAGALAVFVGANGSGRNKVAQDLANDIGTELVSVKLPSVITKYIGETEKNLDSIFHNATKNGAVLFFDEADALFGKRTDVRDAHDRYANLEISYLLELIERHRGIVILASNSSDDLDPALLKQARHFIVMK